MTKMSTQRVKIHSFLKHLLEKKFSRAHRDLEYVIEQKLKGQAFKAKMQGKKKSTASAKADQKVVGKKDSSTEEEK